MVLTATPSTSWSEPPYRLDEGAGRLIVFGYGRAPTPVQHPAQARLMAERAAVIDAYGTASRLLSEAIPDTMARPEAPSVFFRGGRVVQSDVRADGSVRVQLEIPLGPDLAAQVKRVEQRESRAGIQDGETEWISRDEFSARHQVRGPRVITSREWIERYRSGAWVPYNR
jgi:hypothetical protein